MWDYWEVRAGPLTVPNNGHWSTNSFPTLDLVEALGKLQSGDGLISTFRGFWDWYVGPSLTERRNLCLQVVELLRQWKQIVEVDGVLYQQSWEQHERQIRQVIPSAVLKDEILTHMQLGIRD